MSVSPALSQVDGFTVTGFSVRTQNKDEFNENTAKLPGLWHQFYASQPNMNSNVYGVYSSYDSDATGYYTVTVGTESCDVQAESGTVSIQAGQYLVFQGTGPMPATVIETWKRVWKFFEASTEYQRNFISDFEDYSGTDHVAIYIGIK